MAFNSELSAGKNTLLSSVSVVTEKNQEISSSDYERFCNFLEEHSGIVLGQSKEYLLINRLRNILDNARESSFSELLTVLEGRRNRTLHTRVIDAMTTNETLWFRDKYPFEILKDTLLSELSKSGSRPVRFWSAASSTGQEAYSISITIKEYLAKNPGGLPQGYEIVATDLSETALQQAREGSYEKYDVVRGLTGYYQDKYFSADGDKQKICDEIKSKARFQQSNLLQSYSLLGQFDVIFCRNVLIYFSNDVKSDILSRMAKSLKPDGYLFLGGPETINNYSDAFEMVRCKQGVVYRLKD